MGETNKSVVADDDLQDAIVTCVQKLRHDHVVSTNKAIEEVRRTVPNCTFRIEQIVRLIGETALLLGIIPVYDAERVQKDTRRRYGYGHHAHQPDPDGT